MTMDLVRLAGDEPAVAGGAEGHPLYPAVIAALRDVYDPEIPVNLYDLGLIYRLEIDADNAVRIDMTLTAPNCPVADMIPAQVTDAVQAVDDVKSAHVDLVWDPAWTQDRMSESARLALDLF